MQSSVSSIRRRWPLALRRRDAGLGGSHFETFTDALLGERNGTPFPCFFGAQSVRDGEPLYTAVPSMSDPDALFDFGQTLLEVPGRVP